MTKTTLGRDNVIDWERLGNVYSKWYYIKSFYQHLYKCLGNWADRWSGPLTFLTLNLIPFNLRLIVASQVKDISDTFLK